MKPYTKLKNIQHAKWINACLYLIAIVTPLLIAPNTDSYFVRPKLTFIYSMSLVLLVLWFLDPQKDIKQFDKIDLTLFVFIFLMAISNNLSDKPYLAIYGQSYRGDGFLSILSFMFYFYLTRRYFVYDTTLMKYLYISVFLVSFYGILQYFNLDPIPRDPVRIHWRKQAFSTIGNPNFLGTYLTLFFPLSAYRYLKHHEKFHLFLSGTIYLALLATNTRSAWIGVLVSFILLYFVGWIDKFDKKKMIILFLVLMSISLVVNMNSNSYLLSRFSTISRDIKKVMTQEEGFEFAGTSRIFIWTRVVELIKMKPFFGWGIEQIGDVFTDFYRADVIKQYGYFVIVDKAHNEFLHIAVTTGLLSLGVYLLFVFEVLKKSFGNKKLVPVWIAIMGYLAQSFFNISVLAVAYLFWLFLGILSSYRLND